MSEAAKVKYITKTVRFGGKELVLYSIDGTTWSTRRNELLAVKERHEAQRITLNDIKGISPEEEGEKETQEDESSSDEPYELRVDNDDVDDSDAIETKEVKGKKLKASSIPPKSNMRAPVAKMNQTKLPKRAGSPAKMQLVPAKTKKTASKAAPAKRPPAKAKKSKRGQALKPVARGKKSAARRKAA